MTSPVATIRVRRAASHRGWLVDAIALVALAITLLFVLTTVIRSPLKDDVAWLLWVAKKWLGGRDLYVDLVEVNPPLVIWLYAIPAAFSNWLDVAPKLTSTLFFATILVLSLIHI